MPTADYRLVLAYIHVVLFPLSSANIKGRVIQAESLDSGYPGFNTPAGSRLWNGNMIESKHLQSTFYPWSIACILPVGP